MPVGLHLKGPRPPAGWPDALGPHILSASDEAFDVGVVQSHALAVDPDATRRKLELWSASSAETTAREGRWLADNADAVLADMPPTAVAAAAAAGIPAITHGNFSWDWIYHQMGLAEAAAQAERDYRHARLLIELAPACPMPAFERRERVGELGRRPALDPARVRADLGLAGNEQVVLIAIGGSDTSVCALPPPSPDLVYLAPDLPLSRKDVLPDVGTPFIELLGAADLVVAKPGYGIYGDTWATGQRVLLAPRRGFPEDVYLERALASRSGTLALAPEQLERGNWSRELRSILEMERPGPGEAPGGRRAADIIARVLKETVAA
ncbi:MAG: hypothetical protein VB852_07055 [Deltaproteobacteria bacterium]